MGLGYIPVAANYISPNQTGFNTFAPQIAGYSYKNGIGIGALTIGYQAYIDLDNAVIEHTFSRGKTVHFLLDGIDSEQAIRSGSAAYNSYTRHELQFIKDNYLKLKNKCPNGNIIFWRNRNQVSYMFGQ